MKGEIIAVTGAGSGLGACITRRFSEAGASIILLDISEESMKKTAETLKGESARPTSWIYRINLRWSKYLTG